ncbi:MAG: TetR family transcriptional regulator [Eggerthellaceae bacterium]
MAEQKRERGTLTKAEVIAAAYAIIDADGVDACSMRALGSKLGVTAMAVYGYVPSREMLLNEVMARFLERVDTRGSRRAVGRNVASHHALASQGVRRAPSFCRAYEQPVHFRRA